MSMTPRLCIIYSSRQGILCARTVKTGKLTCKFRIRMFTKKLTSGSSMEDSVWIWIAFPLTSCLEEILLSMERAYCLHLVRFYDTNRHDIKALLMFHVHAGEQHRKQRKMLNPIFSTTHMRDMCRLPCTQSTLCLFLLNTLLTVPIFYNVTDKVLITSVFLSFFVLDITPFC